jgi:DNA-directed RNA polymerase specialized sigma24 family protein
VYDRSGTDQREDDQMVRDFIAGKSSGLERVYAAYRTPLYSVARHVLGNDDDALVRIWKPSGSYRPERGSLRGYLLVSVRNEALTRNELSRRFASNAR